MIKSPQCFTCVRYKGDFLCDAFGNKKIPKEILINRHDHTKPFTGDNGLLLFVEKKLNVASSPEDKSN